MARLQSQTSCRPPTTPARTPFERIHFDVIIMEGHKGYGGATCIAHFYCEKTKYHRAWALPSHQQATLLPVFEATAAFAKKFTTGGIKWFRSDDEAGIGDDIKEYLKQDGIEWEVSTPYHPSQNGPAERSGRAIVERGRALLYEANLPDYLWPVIIAAIIFLLNRTPIESLDWKTPYECLYGVKPDLSGIYILGSLTYTLIVGKERERLSKFDPRAIKGYLIGFEASNIYQVWSPITNRVIRARDVKIDESQRYKPDPDPENVPRQDMENIRRIQDIVDIPLDDEIDWIEDAEALAGVQPQQPPNLPPAPSPEPSKEVEPDPLPTPPPSTPDDDPPPPSPSQGEPPVPSPRQPSPTNQPTPQSLKRAASPSGDETGSEIEVLVKRQRRKTQKAKEMPNQDLRRKAFFSSTNGPQNNPEDPSDDDQHPYQQAYRAFATATTRTYGHREDMPPEPKSWKEMLNHPLRDHFRAAAHREIRALIAKHTWDEVEPPKGARTIPTKWTFNYKPDADGFITKFKARLVVRGDLQQGVHK